MPFAPVVGDPTNLVRFAAAAKSGQVRSAALIACSSMRTTTWPSEGSEFLLQP